MRNAYPSGVLTFISGFISVHVYIPSNYVIPLTEEQTAEPDAPLDHLPEKIITDLAQISRWLVTHGGTVEFLKDYTKMRSNMMLKSLQWLVLIKF